jgi:hypothetical protein
MHRARSRDQHFVAGIGWIALERCLSIGDPTGRSIARACNDFPWVSTRIGFAGPVWLAETLLNQGINIQSASKSPGGFL